MRDQVVEVPQYGAPAAGRRLGLQDIEDKLFTVPAGYHGHSVDYRRADLIGIGLTTPPYLYR